MVPVEAHLAHVPPAIRPVSPSRLCLAETAG